MANPETQQILALIETHLDRNKRELLSSVKGKIDQVHTNQQSAITVARRQSFDISKHLIEKEELEIKLMLCEADLKESKLQIAELKQDLLEAENRTRELQDELIEERVTPLTATFPGANKKAVSSNRKRDNFLETFLKTRQPKERLIAEGILKTEDNEKERQQKISKITTLFEKKKATLEKQGLARTPSMKLNRLVFGLPLETVVHLHGKMYKVPPIVSKCITSLQRCALDREGLFRESGSFERVGFLKGQFNKGLDVDLREYEIYPHNIATLLKMYLRELPTPPVPFQFRNAFSQTLQMEEEVRKEQLRNLVQQLPVLHVYLLTTLFYFLAQVAGNQKVNKMSESNLAVVFAPCFFPSRSDENPVDYMNITNSLSGLVAFLIRFCDKIFSKSQCESIHNM